jgi:glycosyltransferase involved in cell wall biosynthesis
MIVSVVIPTLNEAENIGRCIASIAAHWPAAVPVEVLVGDHGSTDETREIAAALGARALSFRGGTVGELRNRVVAECKGSVLVFLDADCTVTPEWGAALPDALHDIEIHRRQITGSICSPPDSNNPFIRFWFARIQRNNTGYIGTGHMIVPTELFNELRGFSAGLRSGEDYDFCMRAKAIGARIVPRQQMKVVHYGYPLSAWSFVRRESWHGSGDFQSFGRFMRSKVAIVAATFSAMQTGAVLFLPFRLDVALMLQGSVVMLVLVASIAKFPHLSLGARIANVGIFYLYLIGRSISLLVAWRQRLPRE